MIVAHLIGGNEIKGFRKGLVFINGKKLETTYEELVAICGNISLGDLDTSTDIRRTSEHVQDDYIKLVKEHDDELDEDFVIKNHLTKEISYSEYTVDFKTETLQLKIETYE